MIPKPITKDFPKDKLRLLFREADEILILQPQKMGDAIMTENFSAGVRKTLGFFAQYPVLDEKQKSCKLILCTAFPEIFVHNPDFDGIISHEEYLSYLKNHLRNKNNLLVIDFSNDPANKIFFEFDRMIKWPVKQRPYFSQITFNWQNLPQGKGEENSIASRYLLLMEQIAEREFFPKPRFPKVYLPKDASAIYQKIVKKYELDPSKYKQVSVLTHQTNPVTELEEEKLFELIELLSKKKRGLEINIIVDPRSKDQKWTKSLQERLLKLQGFSLFRSKKFHIISLNLPELAVFLSKQKLVIGTDSGIVHLSNAVGVKTISLRGPKSRHLISNYRWDDAIYPDIKRCEFLKKSDTWQGKGYIAPCYNEGKCLKDVHCLATIDLEKIIRKVRERL